MDAGKDSSLSDSAPPPPPPALACPGMPGSLLGLDIWVDASSEYLLASGGSGLVVLRRAGDRWSQEYGDRSNTATGIAGLPNGDIVLAGSSECGALVLHDGAAHCGEGFIPEDPFVVSSTLAYAVNGNAVVTFDGTTWTQYLDSFAPLTPWSVWANAQVVATTTTNGNVYISKSGAVFQLAETFGDAAKPDPYPVVWGFGPSDLSVGLRQGPLYHYDGSKWTKQATVVDACGGGIKNLWGADGVLFVQTDSELARVRSGTVDVLHQFPCTSTIRGMSGRSSTDVFLAVADPTKASSTCGEGEVFEWNGTLSQL